MGTIIIRNESNLSDRGALMLIESNLKDLQLKNRDRNAVVIGWDEYVVFIQRNAKSVTYKITDFDKVVKNGDSKNKN